MKPISTGRVLIVEDDPAIRRLLELALTRAGLSVDSAVDGAEAFEMAQKCEHSLIFLDLTLPKVDGHEFLKLLKEHCGIAGKKPLVIVISAVSDLGKLDAEMVAATIRKPFEVAAVQELASSVIGLIVAEDGDAVACNN